MKLSPTTTMFLYLCAGTMIIASGAAMIANRYHGLFFDESFGLLNRFYVNDFIFPVAGGGMSLGWLWRTRIMMKDVKKGSTIGLKQILILLLPILLLWIPSFFNVHFWNIFSSRTEYANLGTFSSGLYFFYLGGFLFSLVPSVYAAPQKNVLE